MVSVQLPPGGREVPYARALLLPAIVMAAVTGAAVAVVSQPARAAVGWCGAVATLLVIATAAEAVRRGRVIRAVRAEAARRTEVLERRVSLHDAEMDHLRENLLPVLVKGMRGGRGPKEAVRLLVDNDPAQRNIPRSQRALLLEVLRIIDHEELQREAAQRSFVNIARRVQAIVHQQNTELREMEEDHGRNPEVFDDLLRIDHGTALIGRLADSIAVLGGGRPGRQWPVPVPLYSALRGAMSRILEYRRIELHSIAKVAVNGIHVEPVIHAAAELLDNATRYSPPHTKVHVTAVEVQTGVAIEIEDAGVSLSEEARLRAERMLAQAAEGPDLNQLGEDPRLGLAVVGRLMDTYDMQVSLRQSAYGGVRAVLVVPRRLLTEEPATGLAHGIGAAAVPKVDFGGVEGPKRAEKKRRPTTGPRPRVPDGMEDDDVPEVTEWTANGLPQRRSRVSVPYSQRVREARAAAAEAEAARKEGRPVIDWTRSSTQVPKKPKEEKEPGLWVEAFMAGLKGGDSDQQQTPDATNSPARTEADDEGDLT
ncbi:signal transduction histidine kinase [Streptomyces aurantiacus]|uniref:ATP-binding protein n=1 Tax=Streptomyces aurantiacus TaxID=47760 RepID=UPI00278E53B7|nr:ATP-binding protein [Streptomyces aurantiacus]MDQ0778457.1 signal transduction histidine kinase [Streptomyces aurantiacus]